MGQLGNGLGGTAQFFVTDRAVNNLVVAAFSLAGRSNFVLLHRSTGSVCTGCGDGLRIAAQLFTTDGAVNDFVVAAGLAAASSSLVLLHRSTGSMALIGDLQGAGDFVSNVGEAILAGTQILASNGHGQSQLVSGIVQIECQNTGILLHSGSIDKNDILIQETLSQALQVSSKDQGVDVLAKLDLVAAQQDSNIGQLVVGTHDHDLCIGVNGLNLIDQIDVAELLQRIGVGIGLSCVQHNSSILLGHAGFQQCRFQFCQSLGNQIVNIGIGQHGPVGVIGAVANQLVDHALDGSHVAEADGD